MVDMGFSANSSLNYPFKSILTHPSKIRRYEF